MFRNLDGVGLIVNIKLSTSDKSCMVSSWKFAAMIFRLGRYKEKNKIYDSFSGLKIIKIW